MTTYQGELTSQEVVKLIEAETDEDGNILEELTDQDVRGIYEQLSHEDKKRFRQFRKFPVSTSACMESTCLPTIWPGRS